MQEALALVRQELGSQAAVLHTREVRPRGLARLWGGGELIEVVASDNVSVPGRLPDPYLNAREQAAPHSPAGIDLTAMGFVEERAADTRAVPASRVAAYLEQGVQPLAAACETSNQPAHIRGGSPLLLVCGAKGAGATTVSWKLAQTLAGQGRRAIWVDGDLSRAAEDAKAASHEGTLADVLSGSRTVHEVLSRGPDGVQCIRRAQGDRLAAFTAADASRCVRQLKSLAPHAEVIIVDAGSDANLLQNQLWNGATAVCVVVTPADDAILRGYSAIKNHRTRSRHVELLTLVNQSDEPTAANVCGRMAKACRQFLDLELRSLGNLAGGDARTDFNLDRTGETLWDVLAVAEGRAADATST